MTKTDIVLKALASGLKVLAENIETIAEEISEAKETEKQPEPTPVSKPKTAPAAGKTRKAAPKAKKKTAARKTGTKKPAVRKRKSGTDTDYVLKIIADAEEDIGLADLCEKTGFSNSKVRGIVHRLKKKELITGKKKGFYSKA